MDRLTYDFQLGGRHCWLVKGADNLECREVCQRQEDRGCTDCPIAKAFDRLAAYEDTGLEPEEIDSLPTLWMEKVKELLEIGPIDRLRELKQASDEGRCVVLPCKIGDQIYMPAYDIPIWEKKEESNMDQQEHLQLHKKICNDLAALFERKNHDYGDSFHQIFLEEGWPMVRIRLSDKLNRVKALTKGDSQKVQDESLRDTLMDLANYAILAVMEMDRRKDQR